MKNNASFLIVTATAVAALALCFGSIADFSPTATPQIASATTSAADVAPATSADATHRIE